MSFIKPKSNTLENKIKVEKARLCSSFYWTCCECFHQHPCSRSRSSEVSRRKYRVGKITLAAVSGTEEKVSLKRPLLLAKAVKVLNQAAWWCAAINVTGYQKNPTTFRIWWQNLQEAEVPVFERGNISLSFPDVWERQHPFQWKKDMDFVWDNAVFNWRCVLWTHCSLQHCQMVAPRWRGQNQARHVSFLLTYDEHTSSACENLAQSIQKNFNSFYSYPVIVWKGLHATHRRAVTVITSQLQEPDIFVFQATFEIWKGILSISVKKKICSCLMQK